MSDYGNESPIEDYGGKRPRKTKKSTEEPKQARKRPLPLEQYDPDDRTKIILSMIAIGIVAMMICMILLGTIDLLNFTVNLVISLLLGVATVLATRELVLSRFSATHPVEQQVRVARVTQRIAAKNERVAPSNQEVTWLMPSDLRHTFYDDRHNTVYLGEIFVQMFTRWYKGKHRVRRALRNWVLLLIICALVTLVIAAWPLHAQGRELAWAAAFGAALLCFYTVYGMLHCLYGYRLVITRRICVVICNTLPFMPEDSPKFPTRTITQTKIHRPFLGKVFGYTHHEIRTSEAEEILNIWRYARHGDQLDYALSIVNKDPQAPYE